MKKNWIIGGLLGAVGLAAAAFAQTITVPQVALINSGDLFQDVVNGAPQAGNVYAPASVLANYFGSLPQKTNAIIGGDATTNLFQRGTTGSSVTTTLTYGGPDRWAYWSGTNTAMTVSQDTTAADLPSNYKASFKMARTSGQTGVVQVCMAQEVESADVYAFQGQIAELDFHAQAGATFSAANSTLNAYIITGTGADEGLSKMAFAFNAGGGGSSTWAGQANATVGAVTISTTNSRYAVVAAIPATATEIGVVFCFTPVGTAGANDYVSLAGIQLTRNAGLSAFASATVGYNLSSTPPAFQASSFLRRSIGQETTLQQRFTYSINEASITAGAIAAGGGTALGTTTTCSINIRFPVTMRTAPTYTNALSASTFKITSASQAATALSTPFSATLAANSIDSASINFTTTGMTAKDSCELVSAAGTGQMLWTAEL